MAAPLARRAILRASSSLSTRSSPSIALFLRPYSTPSTPATPSTSSKTPLSSEPYKTSLSPIYPPPKDPFNPEASQPASAKKHSPTKVALVKGIAKLMGYNSTTTTAIRETSRMCGEIVKAVERDNDFWYRECALPPTYQTFFQLHLLHLLLLLPRLRALPSSSLSTIYQSELLTNFFSLAETQMRITLGQGERERVVKGYMKQMGEQWKGGGLGFDYALARSGPVPRGSEGLESVTEGEGAGDGADVELASWIWRNLFAARGAPLLPSAPSPSSSKLGEPASPVEELQLAVNLNKIVLFIRREMYRLDGVSDEDVMQGNIGQFGLVEGGVVEEVVEAETTF